MSAEGEENKETVSSSSEAREVAQLWRRAWSDRSRSETLLKAGPGFFLWRSISDGRRGSGMFYARSLIDDVIADSGMADEVRKLIDELDHQQSVVVVLGFEEEGKATVITVAKLEPPFEQTWFEMPEIRRRSLTSAVWVPLRASQKLLSAGDYGYEGYREEYVGVGSAMFPIGLHEKALRLEWTDIGISQNFTGGQITHYLPPGEHSDTRRLFNLRIPFSQARFRGLLDVPSPERKEITTLLWAGDFEASRSDEIGTGLVIDQHINSKERSVWHLHQDLVIALGLMREGDVWVRPEEGYLEIARLLRSDSGEPVLLEMRAEHLRDYLCARQSYLYVSSYRSRREVTQVRDHINWDPTAQIQDKDFARWEGRVSEIHEGGTPYGATTAVMHVARTDVDDEEDVPQFDFPTDDRIETESWTHSDTGRKLYLVTGELWRTQVIEAARTSERVLSQRSTSRIEFIVDGAGNRESSDTLEHGSRWLWFKPEVIRSILQYRGSSLGWYTRDTGNVTANPAWSGVHFGINSLGLVNIYAKDIALLPDWQQRVWAGFNVAPDGKVSAELLDSQMRAEPADTKAPESELRRVYDVSNEQFARKTGRPLFRPHQAIDELFLKAHRFRSLDRAGLLELAKDLARLTVESLDGTTLNVIVAPPKGMKSGSIRHLETALATLVDEPTARRTTSVLAGINELRQADAHMPSSDLGEALKLAGINETGVTLHEARQMLQELVDSLLAVANIVNKG